MSNGFNAKDFLLGLSTKPGVYQMLDVNGQVIYVGKAKNLKNRVTTYFSKGVQSAKTQAMVELIADIRITVTQSEQEALLLECNLIKEHRPKYNVLMRDDKSYPYIMLSRHKQYPRVDFYRGKRHKNAKYFGPYPSVSAVRYTLKLLQKLFKLRQCTDTFFKQRERPCLQYQINRCSAPCVKIISEEDYAHEVHRAELFLSGKSQVVVDDLLQEMEKASADLHFEKAAHYRDLITKIKHVQSRQHVNVSTGCLDVFAVLYEAPVACVAQLVIREGQVIASQCHYPKVPVGSEHEEVLSSFLSQHYLLEVPVFGIPKEIVINLSLPGKDCLVQALFQQHQRMPKIKHRVKADRAKWLEMALNSAKENLSQKRLQKLKDSHQMSSLQTLFHLEIPPQRLECFDISHTQGEATVGACVVFGAEGPMKEYYRRYNIKGITPGDDYAAMRQALLRRYQKLLDNTSAKDVIVPDVVFIDGGKGQLSVAIDVMDELGMSGVLLVGVAKGPSRKPGLEKIIIASSGKELLLSVDDPALLMIQQIRDEAHRFAITGHRAQRKKARSQSSLENIAGIGAKRRRELLKQFGGLQGLQKASVEDIAGVTGISAALARRIYEHLH